MTTTDSRAAPVTNTQRITTLDAVRGIAVLGILTMNAVSYGLDSAAYFNIDAGGSDTWLDWLIGGAGEIFFDQKFMALFSMLFGAGIVLFAERAEAKGRHANWFSLWRNTLLLGIGVVHSLLWDGDILIVYALCAPVLIVVRKLPPRVLLVAGTATVLLSAVGAAIAQTTVEADGSGLSSYWTNTGSLSDTVGVWLLVDFFARALGMMLIGVAFHRTGVITGARPTDFYRRMTAWGLGVGLPITAAGFAWVAASDFSSDVALVGTIPNTVATIPVALGYLGAITLWNGRRESRGRDRVRSAGRMALTNYLSQTVIGILVLRGLFDPADVTRTGLAVFILGVWVAQLAWSDAWLARFRYGPAEWLWRCATYRTWQPLRRAS